MDSVMEHSNGEGESSSIETELESQELGMQDAKGTTGTKFLWVPEHTVVIILQMILLIILCIVGTLTNSLVFWIFNRRPALRSLSNRFVLSLVTANILISTLISPLLLFDSILAQYLLLPPVSTVIATVSNSVLFSAIFSTVLIAMDRFYAVTSPLHYSMTITRRRSQFMIVLAWIAGILLALPTILLEWGPLAAVDFTSSARHLATSLQTLLGWLLPFLGLCWLYLRMYHAAHRNSERTRKHSISGELLTVMDGGTTVIPQGIDFLTHYMNPFSRTPMSGAIQTTGSTTPGGVLVTVAVKKQRRRSSNGSSSSLLFREEGRAIKTAFFVLASFLLCWTPHFVDIGATLFESPEAAEQRVQLVPYGGWSRFLGVAGMLLSSVLNPFIYVFRNKMAWKEVTKLLCGFIREATRKKSIRIRRVRKGPRPLEKGSSTDTGPRTPRPTLQEGQQSSLSTSTHGSCADCELGSPSSPVHHSPILPPPKGPRRSSMKSLTPQSSLNSNSTQVNFTTAGDSSSSADSPVLILNKPPFLRSLTLPEQKMVKFPPIFTRQKSYVHRTVSSPPVTAAIGNSSLLGKCRRPQFLRQDSICSIMSNDSVLMFCPEERYPGSCVEMGNCEKEGEMKAGANPASPTEIGGPESSPPANHGTPSHSTSNESGGSFGGIARSYLRQDSNFSDASQKTIDSGVVTDPGGNGRGPLIKEAETTFTTFVAPGGRNCGIRTEPRRRATGPGGQNVKMIFCTGACVHDLPLLQTSI